MECNTCCFTGHRPSRFEFGENEEAKECIYIKEFLEVEIVNLIEYCNVKRFITGMALGVDTWAAEAVLALKEKYDIALVAAIPYPEQTRDWSLKDKKRYHDILERCDEKVVVSPEFSKDVMQKRNKYMVDNSEYVIGIWDGNLRSGTANTLKYAQKQNKDVQVLRYNKQKFGGMIFFL